MTEINEILEKYINIDLRQAVLSGARGKDGPSKIRIRPILLKDTLMYQCTKTVGTKEFHSNYTKEEVCEMIGGFLQQQFGQLQLDHMKAVITVLVSKKGKVTVRCKKRGGEPVNRINLQHNRKKQYILEDGKPVDFLIDLGVMNQSGRVLPSGYDKFRQVNRFLEFIEDILPKLPQDREVTIVDFGCGKSYLTFAVYYYLQELRGYNIHMIGLDLKDDVITYCNQLCVKYGYEKLNFYQGDIASYKGISRVDMVVTLHACDTATDDALAKAVDWGAAVILAVPCCQHELNGQIFSEVLEPVFSYGIIKERMAALFTDAFRAQMLETAGYDTQILEFIDMEHTPKNLLIRAVRSGIRRGDSKKLKDCMDLIHAKPVLETLLLKQGSKADEKELN